MSTHPEPSATPSAPGDSSGAETSGGAGKSGGESMLTVLIALTANVLIAIAKSVVGFLTGSASMVAEAAHSWADAGNEVFLVIAERRSAKPKDQGHPYGYGREAYVWSMFAAFGLFTAGSIVSIWHGFTSLFAEESGGEVDYRWAYAVLALAFVLEGISFLQARKQSSTSAARMGLSTMGFIVRTSNPTLRAVFFEDAAALIGIVIAGSGIVMHQITGDAWWDAAGSIAVGVLLGVLAIFLIGRNRDFLVGQVASLEIRRQALDNLLSNPLVERVTFLHVEFVGARQMLVTAAVDIVGDGRESVVAEQLQQVGDGVKDVEMVLDSVITLSRPEDPSIDPATYT